MRHWCGLAGLVLLSPCVHAWKVAYVHGGDIWTVNGDGSGRRRLTSDGVNEFPQWSPRGGRLLFLKVVRPGSYGERGCHLWVMRADGTGKRRLFGARDLFAFPWQGNSFQHVNWSPDGKWIATSSTNTISLSQGHHDSSCTGDLWVVRSDGRQRRHLVRGERDAGRGYMTCYTWSPDSRRLIYWNTEMDQKYFTIVELRGRRHILKFAEIPSSGSLGQHDPLVLWRDDGRLAFGLNDDWDKRSIANDYSLLRVVSSSGKVLLKPRYVADVGAFAHRRDRAVCEFEPKDNWFELWVTDLRCRKLVKLTAFASPGHSTPTSWSPDDRLVAIRLWGMDRVEVYSASNGRRVGRFAPQPKSWDAQVRWAPDSTHLVVQVTPPGDPTHGDRPETGPVYVVPARGGKAMLLARDTKLRNLSVSPH